MAEKRNITTANALLGVGVLVVTLMGGLLALTWKNLPPQLPWFYSLPWGERQLIDKLWFVWIFLGMQGVLLLTRVIANWAGKDDKIVQNTVMIGSVVVVVLMAASFFRVMMIFLSR